MRFVTLNANGKGTLGCALGNHYADLNRAAEWLADTSSSARLLLPQDMLALIRGGPEALGACRAIAEELGARTSEPDGLRMALRRGVLLPRSEARLLAPLPNPGRIFCLGLNYAQHAAETGKPLPAAPLIFAKFNNAIIGPGQPIVLPLFAPDKVDLEVELAVVIGRRAHRVDESRARECVFGYTAMNDVSARDLQAAHSQWLLAKSPDTFAPMGPEIVTADEVPDPHNLRVRSWLNGAPMQDACTADMIFRIPYLIHYLSQLFTLEPGDMISTGTPAGVGSARKPPLYLRPGDVARIEVEGVGQLENPVKAEKD